MKDPNEQTRQIYQRLAITNQALQSTSDIVIIADNEGVSIFVNQAFSDLFKYTVNELNTGGIPYLLFQRPTVGEHIFATVQEEKNWKGEVELKTKYDEIIPFLLNVDAICDDDQTIGFITIGTNISHQRHINALQSRYRILAEAQLDTAKALTSTLDLNEVFRRMLDNISQVVTNDAANIILIQDGKAVLVDSMGYTDDVYSEGLLKDGIHVDYFDDLRIILEKNSPIVISNVKHYLAKNDHMKVHTPWLNSHIGIPIRLKDKIIGFLNVDSIHPNLFRDEHSDRLQLFAEYAAVGIQNARLYEQAQLLAAIEERQRLARNLHDAVSQTLFSASIIAEALPQLWRNDPDKVWPRLEQIRTLTRGALAEMRSLLLELHPERLLETSIDDLMQQLVDGVLGQTRMDITLEVDDGLSFDSDIHVTVYYVTQEALNNIIKHADATRVEIQLTDNPLQLVISDNGRGFDRQQIEPTNLGLNSMYERAHATNAQLEIKSVLGQGTQIVITW